MVTEYFDELLDRAHDMGAPVRWGRLAGTHKHWVTVLLPDGPAERIGETYERAAEAILTRDLAPEGSDHHKATA